MDSASTKLLTFSGLLHNTTKETTLTEKETKIEKKKLKMERDLKTHCE